MGSHPSHPSPTAVAPPLAAAVTPARHYSSYGSILVRLRAGKPAPILTPTPAPLDGSGGAAGVSCSSLFWSPYHDGSVSEAASTPSVWTPAAASSCCGSTRSCGSTGSSSRHKGFNLPPSFCQSLSLPPTPASAISVSSSLPSPLRQSGEKHVGAVDKSPITPPADCCSSNSRVRLSHPPLLPEASSPNSSSGESTGTTTTTTTIAALNSIPSVLRFRCSRGVLSGGGGNGSSSSSSSSSPQWTTHDLPLLEIPEGSPHRTHSHHTRTHSHRHHYHNPYNHHENVSQTVPLFADREVGVSLSQQLSPLCVWALEFTQPQKAASPPPTPRHRSIVTRYGSDVLKIRRLQQRRLEQVHTQQQQQLQSQPQPTQLAHTSSLSSIPDHANN